MEPFDFGIITVIEDEFEAILDQFSETPANTPDRHSGEREYGLRQLKTVNNRQYNIAIANCGAQGNLPSKDLAEDMIRELKPRWLLLVGIAGAIPSSDFGLGDVAISSYIHDFSLEALLPRGKHEFSVSGGPLHKSASSLVADLKLRLREMKGWNLPEKIGQDRPSEKFVAANCTTADVKWRSLLRESIAGSFKPARPPIATARRFASSDRLVKDNAVPVQWRKVARHAEIFDMESAGVLHAANSHHVPFLAMRGISDVVGYRRSNSWKKYACLSVASFVRSYLQTEPVPPYDSTLLRMEPITSLHHVNLPVKNLDRSIQFYRDVLHLKHLPQSTTKEVRLGERPDFGFRGAWFELPSNQQLHLVEYRRGASRQRANPTTARKDFFKDSHLALRVRNYPEAYEFLNSLPDVRTIRGPLALQCYVFDPDNHVIEINGFSN